MVGHGFLAEWKFGDQGAVFCNRVGQIPVACRVNEVDSSGKYGNGAGALGPCLQCALMRGGVNARRKAAGDARF